MNYINLQGIGDYPAVPVRDVKIDDVRVYNYGYTYKVVSIELNKTGTMRVFRLRNMTTGEVFTEKKRLDTLVAVSTLRK